MYLEYLAFKTINLVLNSSFNKALIKRYYILFSSSTIIIDNILILEYKK